MKAREKPSLKVLIDVIAKHGPVEMNRLLELLPISHTPIYRMCKFATEQGYLSAERIKKEGVCGRRHLTYTRTAKRYTPPAPAPKTLLNRMYKERAREAAKAAKALDEAVKPFRHWQDSLLFGAYPKPYEPKIRIGRVYKQSMEVTDDELEAA